MGTLCERVHGGIDFIFTFDKFFLYFIVTSLMTQRNPIYIKITFPPLREIPVLVCNPFSSQQKKKRNQSLQSSLELNEEYETNLFYYMNHDEPNRVYEPTESFSKTKPLPYPVPQGSVGIVMVSHESDVGVNTLTRRHFGNFPTQTNVSVIDTPGVSVACPYQLVVIHV